MSEGADKHKEVFKEEAKELLAELETSLLELEEQPDNADLIGRVFRAMHTIKGSGAMFGFDDIAKFTHDVETVFDLVRNGNLPVTKELITLTLAARDQIREMLNAYDGGQGADPAKALIITSALKQLVPGGAEKEKKTAASPAGDGKAAQGADASAPTEVVTYRIGFRPARNFFLTGMNPVGLLNELRELGDCTIVAETSDIPLLNDLDPEACYTYWNIILTTKKSADDIKDIFIFIQDDCELKIDIIDKEGALEAGKDRKKLGDILVERGDVTQEAVKQALSGQKRVGQILVEMGVVKPEKVEAALAEQEHVNEVREKRQSVEAASTIRVPSERLDSLVNLVGELVTVQARFSQVAGRQANTDLLSIAEEVERLTGELRDNTMSIRMLPIGSTFSKFKRLVRDLSRELGKEIDLTTEGAETELDKTVIEKLGDPLVHLIRNSIDHGIELPEVRAAAGKPRQGNVHLSAVHSGANVLIRIEDDGAGLDKDAIRAKGIEKGLIQADAELTDKELFLLILAPGFSTAKKVTSVSGRGVGMDVVQQALNTLRATIDIKSERGIGTSITLKLPLTLAIIDGFLTKIGEQHFIFPLSLVEECVELTRDDVVKAHNRHMAHVRGHLVPYIRLREHFLISGEAPAIEQIVITRVEDGRVGFVVDHIVGGHQTVIKNLGRFYKDAEGTAGATVLGDGTVALILDVPKLMHAVEREEVRNT